MSSRAICDDPSGPVDVIDVSTYQALCDDIAGHLNAQMGRLLDLTIWLVDPDNERHWAAHDVWRPQQYLAWRCGIGPALASNLVAAAERSDELPASIDAVRRGELSFDQLMPIVRQIPAWADEQVVSLAKKLTVSQIQRLVRDTNWDWTPVRRIDAEDGSAQGVTQRRAGDSAPTPDDADPCVPMPDLNRVTSGTGPDGRWWLHADLDPDLGLLIERALDESRDALFQRDRGRGDDSVFRPITDTDALVEIAQRSLDTITEPSRRNRFRINLQLDVDATVHTDHHDRLPDSISRLLTCASTIDPVFVKAGTPLSVGRTQRTIPDRTRRTVLHRDQHTCQVPGCNATRGLDLHHLVHWADGGRTDTANLLTLCARHHRLHHRHRLAITGNADQPDTLVFIDARGRPIRTSGADPHPPNAPPGPIRGEYRHPLGEQLESRWVSFNNPNIPPLLRHLQHPDTA